MLRAGRCIRMGKAAGGGRGPAGSGGIGSGLAEGRLVRAELEMFLK